MRKTRVSFVLGTLGLLVFAGCDQQSGYEGAKAKRSSATTADSAAQPDPVVAAPSDETPKDDASTKSDTPDANNDPAPPAAAVFTLTSSAFQNNQMMPAQYVAKGGGGNQSPPLQWAGAPAGAGSFAIQMVDLDFLSPAPSPFIHWVITGIPATTKQLPVAIPTGATLTTPTEVAGASQPRGVYRGPNPPNLHRYEFTIYAIKPGMTLTIGADSVVNRTELESKSLGKATIVGTYQ